MLDTEGDPPKPAMETLKALVGKLEARARDRVNERMGVETRWIEDLRLFHGRHDEDTEANLAKMDGRSKAFINMVRPKTLALSARLIDMLFPTDDKAYQIKPSPVPELTVAAEMAAEKALKALSAAESLPEDADEAQVGAAQQQADEAQSAMDQLDAQQDEARKRARAMELEIDDTLRESRFQAEARDVIEDACKVGTGVMRGPVTGRKLRRRFKRQNTPEGPVHVLVEDTDPAPSVHRVDYWSFFPDMSARRIEDGEGVFMRHLYTRKQVRALAKIDGFNADALRRTLSKEPETAYPQNMAALIDLRGENTSTNSKRYHVWEYEGPLDSEEVAILAAAMGDSATWQEAAEADPLQEINCVVWFCDGELLRFDLHPLDSGDVNFSTFVIERDESGPFGYGWPALMREVQQAYNAGWRMVMDNAGAASGPQAVIDRETIEPEDGYWTVTPWKVWTRIRAALGGSGPAFEFVQPSMNLNQLLPMLDALRILMDDVLGQPTADNAEPGTQPQQTATGTALVMSSRNVVYRRIVKNWDDDVTVPTLTRLYHWLMQHSPKDYIKGDHMVDARGSSVLLVREMTTQNIMTMLQVFGNEDPDIDAAALKRELIRALMLSGDGIIRSEAERREFISRLQAQGMEDPAQAIEREKMELKREEVDTSVAMAQLEWNTRLEIAKLQFESAMQGAAAKLNEANEKIEAMRAEARAERDSRERVVAVEAAVKERTGDSAGGYV